MCGPDPVLSAAPWERHVLADPPAVVPTLRRELVAYARVLGASDRTCDAITLAVSEALTNIVRHAVVTLRFSLPGCDPISQEWAAAGNVDRNVHS